MIRDASDAQPNIMFAANIPDEREGKSVRKNERFEPEHSLSTRRVLLRASCVHAF